MFLFYFAFQHKYVRIGGGYRHSYWHVKALLEEIELQVRNNTITFSINRYLTVVTVVYLLTLPMSIFNSVRSSYYDSKD